MCRKEFLVMFLFSMPGLYDLLNAGNLEDTLR